MGEFVASLFNGVDKLTDILNVGRLIFYTSAGFCGILPATMLVRLLAEDSPARYWKQFAADLVFCARRGEAWFAALIFGFVIANVAYTTVIDKLGRPGKKEEPDKEGYAYQYARLSSGGTQPKTERDFAAWWISEYYRYVEIAVFIPFGILLSLPLYSLYSLAYLIRVSNPAQPFVIGAAHYAFALWAVAAVVGWGMVWPWYWIPKIAEPIFEDSTQARREVLAGLTELMGEVKSPETSK
jgi:hypothetical protein